MNSNLEAQRVLDLLLVLLFSPVWVPVLGLCALLIWLSDPRAPVVFGQYRVGKDARRFRMLKFRSMVADADELKLSLLAFNEREWPDFKMTNDPRITPLGRLLRKSSLDELPQLFNVIRGDMSLVGPRPTSFDLSTYATWQTERLEVRPGLTGFWQVWSRDSEFDERVRMDIRHVRAFSLRDSLLLLLCTIPAALKGR